MREYLNALKAMERGDFRGQELTLKEQVRQEEAREIVRRVNDPRLHCDEHLEYFTIHFQNKVSHVPKRRINEAREINKYIESDLRQMLDKES